jgi:hypothetical protein
MSIAGIRTLRRAAGATVLAVVTSIAAAAPATMGLAAAGTASAASAVTNAVRTPARAAGSWGKAIEVPGLAALNKGRSAYVGSVSCASSGSCAAGGGYTDRHHHAQGFVAVERNGRWGKAIGVPGLAALSGGLGAEVDEVACGAAGSCVAGGSYSGPHDGIFDPVIATERGGRWGKAVDLLINGGINSISCASAGNCLAAGGAGDLNAYFEVGDAFVVEQRAGRWGSVRFIRGLRKLEHFGDPESAGSWISSAACGSPGNCAAGGVYQGVDQISHGFVAVERNGRWGAAVMVPGLAALNAGRESDVNSVSCGSAGNCAAGGDYKDGAGHHQGFLVAERNGVWGTATEVPGLSALNSGGNATVWSVSCGSAGSCVAGGDYADGIVPPKPRGHFHGFLVAERNGRWGTAMRVPGLAALNTSGRDTVVGAVSCASAGNCGATGSYTDRSHHHRDFVVIERNGRWGRAMRVPGLAALNTSGRDTFVFEISCAAAGSCAAGGYYKDRSGHEEGFVTQGR